MSHEQQSTDDIFRKSFDNYRVAPSADLWGKVEREMRWKRFWRFAWFQFNVYYLLLALSLVAGAFVYLTNIRYSYTKYGISQSDKPLTVITSKANDTNVLQASLDNSFSDSNHNTKFTQPNDYSARNHNTYKSPVAKSSTNNVEKTTRAVTDNNSTTNHSIQSKKTNTKNNETPNVSTFVQKNTIETTSGNTSSNFINNVKNQPLQSEKTTINTTDLHSTKSNDNADANTNFLQGLTIAQWADMYIHQASNGTDNLEDTARLAKQWAIAPANNAYTPQLIYDTIVVYDTVKVYDTVSINKNEAIIEETNKLKVMWTTDMYVSAMYDANAGDYTAMYNKSTAMSSEQNTQQMEAWAWNIGLGFGLKYRNMLIETGLAQTTLHSNIVSNSKTMIKEDIVSEVIYSKEVWVYKYDTSNVVRDSVKVLVTDTIRSTKPYYHEKTNQSRSSQTHRYIEIPLLLGYDRHIKRFDIGLRAGLITSISSTMNFSLLPKAYDDEASTPDQLPDTLNISIEVPQPTFRKLLFSVQGGAHVAYNITPRLKLYSDAFYRRSLSSLANEAEHKSLRFNPVGIKFGMIWRF